MTTISHPMPIPTPPRGTPAVNLPGAVVRRPGRHRLVRPSRWQRVVGTLTNLVVSR